MDRKVSQPGRARIREREGEVLHTYYDSRGVLTGGVGHTGRMAPPKLTPGMTITKEMSDAWLEADLGPVEAALAKVLKVPVTQNQFDALASFLFNVGTGWAGVSGHRVASIFNRLNAGDVKGAADAFDMFHSPPEVTGRRNSEKAQFLTPDAAPIASRPAPSSATSIIEHALHSGGPSPATPSAPSAAKESTMNPISILGSLVAPNMSVLSTVIQIGTHIPDIIEGVENVVPPAQKAYEAFQELFADIQGKGKKEGGVVEDVQEIVARISEIWEKSGLDPHKAADVGAVAPQLPAASGIEALKRVLHI